MRLGASGAQWYLAEQKQDNGVYYRGVREPWFWVRVGYM